MGVNTNSISIIGLGVIGLGIAKTLKKYAPTLTVIGYDVCHSLLELCKDFNYIDIAAESVIEAVKKSEFIIIAVPTDTTIEILKNFQNNPICREKLIIDVCSVKEFSTEFKQWENFIPCHPIAGALPFDFKNLSQSIQSLSSETFFGTTTYVTRINETEKSFSYEKQAVEFWQLMGCQRVNTSLTPSAHDRIFALTSHLPHFIGISLIPLFSRNKKISANLFSATSFYRNSSKVLNPNMWIPIFLRNSNNINIMVELFLNEFEKIAFSDEKSNCNLPTMISMALGSIMTTYEEYYGAGCCSMLLAPKENLIETSQNTVPEFIRILKINMKIIEHQDRESLEKFFTHAASLFLKLI